MQSPQVAIAIHAWQGDGGGKRCLTFEAGERIKVIEAREAGGWWSGALDGRQGWFPSSFCRIEEEADEADLLAAGMMSGVEHEDEEMLAEAAAHESDSMSTSSMRRLLSQQLGGEVFERAHARLRTVAVEEDDDGLVRDIQQILGPGKLDMLPMILKLIFQEEQGG